MATRRGRAWVNGVGAAIASVVVSSPSSGKERLVRQLGSDLATPPQYVRKLAQDTVGYLWAGTDAGLYRYDGAELRKWAPEAIPMVWDIATGRDGSVYAAGRAAAVHRVTATG